MTESESVALPLGDSAISFCFCIASSDSYIVHNFKTFVNNKFKKISEGLTAVSASPSCASFAAVEDSYSSAAVKRFIMWMMISVEALSRTVSSVLPDINDISSQQAKCCQHQYKPYQHQTRITGLCVSDCAEHTTTILNRCRSSACAEYSSFIRCRCAYGRIIRTTGRPRFVARLRTRTDMASATAASGRLFIHVRKLRGF